MAAPIFRKHTATLNNEPRKDQRLSRMERPLAVAKEAGLLAAFVDKFGVARRDGPHPVNFLAQSPFPGRVGTADDCRRQRRFPVSVSAALYFLASATGSFLVGGVAANAANTGCDVTGSVADCAIVPTDGISYTSTVKTVNINDISGGETSVTSSVEGIYLTESAASGSSSTNTAFNDQVGLDLDNDSDTPLTYVVSTPGGVPILSGGQYIIVTGANAFSINGTPYNGTQLAQYLASTSDDSGGSVSGSLTINSPNPYPGPVGGIVTTDAHGIFIQSTGGDGGDGGCSTVLFYTWCDSGDGGGAAGSVVVNSNGEITVNGTAESKYGISAVSQGGNGGDGGGSFGLFASDAGAGGIGGAGGAVEVHLGADSDITTSGKYGHGVYAVSRGGKGGGGGTPYGTYAGGDEGGRGGGAGDVLVDNKGSILTAGEAAYGINASSVGGAAGDGSDAFGIGADGGEGGGSSPGGIVTVRNSGSIETTNSGSFGIFAQSVGGGGGDGGSTGGVFSVGGNGASGGNGGIVKAYNSGSVTTGGAVGGSGDDAVGVFLQSVGGGGGNGGGAVAVGVGVSLAIGGSGAIGGAGAAVTYNPLDGLTDANGLTSATIGTTGDRSHGIQAQSVGGGGGNGGYAYSGAVPVGGVSLSISLGGTGGPGGASDAVIVNEKGVITTAGANSIGIFAQSVGGGGGNGGGTVAAAVGGSVNLSVAIGGEGGVGGASSTVNVNSVGAITTAGIFSHGIMAQSVGGGGGNGGFAVAASIGGFAASVALGGGAGGGGIGSDVTVNTIIGDVADAGIATSGDGAIGILAQSIGGGGGNGGVAGTLSAGSGSLGVSLGGAGGGGAIGGAVDVTNRNSITTTGNTATGIFAQSVGGGGGNGGGALSGAGGVVGIAVAVGGSGGGGSNGGMVTVNNYGTITTGFAVESLVDGETVVDLFGSRSYGIFAQSVGGGGGNGGYAISAALGVSIPDVPGGAAAISVGGTGGGASDGDLVTVNNHGGIETFGLGSHAIFAQSVGGGGGNGGIAGSVAMTVGGGVAVGVAVGGAGSGGGDAGVVTVNTYDDLKKIITHADGADGIHAQSVGGGGGDGGFAMSGAFGFGGEVSVSVAVAIGGAGGAGGKGEAVNVSTYQAITTFGNNSIGVMAQSVGGGGGNGGMAVTGTLAFSETAGAVGVSVGGAGGTGNTSNTVTVDNYGAITTWGLDSMGILAQSIGGSGGNGGLAIAAQMTGSTKNGATVGVTVGGGAGDGSFGGIVNVTNHVLAAILTNGLGAHGIKAQSIGGGGGNGGLAVTAQLGISSGSEAQASKTLNVGASVGGDGGTGGYGNTVHVINDGSITVKGAAATGIFAQSVGGGGGDGGMAVSAVGMLTDSTNASSRSVVATVAIGGKGGDANIGGLVTVDNSGSIITEGVSGHAVYAQSIGGGGGVGGRANTLQMVVTKPLPVAGADSITNKNNMQLGVTIGGNGGTGGHGGNVVVNNHGTIETAAETSDGIFAQSVGGGGGDGGNGALGPEGLFPLPGGTITIQKALGVFGLQGAVPIYKNVQVVVGGSGGATGDGGTVEVNNDKNITTRGSNSNGIFAQSVGGGGGVGGKATIGATGLLGLGGEGTGGGDGAFVKVNQYGNATIETFGVASYGVFAQSVGGGGGIAGNVDRLLANKTAAGPLELPALNVGVGLAFGRDAGGGGDGGAIDVDVDGLIKTHGNNAAGIFAQSVGGGGGMLGELGNDLPVLSLLSWQLGSKGDVGNAGQVDVDLTGMIMTSGNNSTGIFAQSAAGATGGGHAGIAGNVNVTVNGSVLTGQVLTAEDDGTVEVPLRGLGSTGILAQSAADDNANNGNVVVTVNGVDTAVMGGRSSRINADDGYVGVGVWIMDGKTNVVTNKGLISTVDGVDGGYAILATGSDATHTGGNEAVSNSGTVTGSFNLGLGSNSFNNEVDAVFNSGRFASVGTGLGLMNNGWMSPGGDRRVMTTEITGIFTQSATGTYGVDMDLALTALVPALTLEPAEADVLLGTQAMSFDGMLDLTLLNIGSVLPGEHQVLLARSETGLTKEVGFGLAAPSSAVATYGLATTATDLLLDYAIDFSPVGANPNQTAMGDYINNFQTAFYLGEGDPTAMDPVIEALFNLPDLESYSSALDQLSPEPYVANQVSSYYGALDFENSLLSCRVYGGAYKFNAEGECVWTSLGGATTKRDGTTDNLAYRGDKATFATGGQYAVSQNVRAGLGFSYETLSNSVGDGSQSKGDRLQVGGALKGTYGGTTIAGTVSGGIDMYDVKRIVALPNGPSFELDSSQNITYVSAHGRISHTFGQDTAYIRPYIDAGISQIFAGGFTEQGVSPVALDVASSTQTFVTVEAAVEVGGEIRTDDERTVLRPFAGFGVFALKGNSPGVTAKFTGAPDSVDGFTVHGDVDDKFMEVRFGFDVISKGGFDFRALANAQLGQTTTNYGGTLKFSAAF